MRSLKMCLVGLLWATVTLAEELAVTVLTPEVRVTDLIAAETELTATNLKQHFVKVDVSLMPDILQKAPQVDHIAEQKLLATQNQYLYVAGLTAQTTKYAIYEPAKPLQDPKTGEFLGMPMRMIAEAHFVGQHKNVSKLRVLDNFEALHRGMLVLPYHARSWPKSFANKPAVTSKRGYVKDINTVLQGKFDSVFITLGARDGVTVGETFKILRHYHFALEPQDMGDILVYQVFDKVSLGLIMRARSAILANDIVQSHSST